jgi:hypothetical protein
VGFGGLGGLDGAGLVGLAAVEVDVEGHAAMEVSRMPDSSRGCRLWAICWVQRGATRGIMPAPMEMATM